MYTTSMDILPQEFFSQSLRALADEERPAFEAAMLASPVRALRIRNAACTRIVRETLPDIGEPVPWAENAYYIDMDSLAGSHPLHAAGAYYLQEASAMAPVSALDVAPGLRVLDLCAAPGGKSTQIGALLGGHGVLVANETVPSRARILSQNIERMGIPNAVVTCMPADRLADSWGAWFDRVLVDAPCSGEGMFRREPHARAEWTPQSPQGCARRQREILCAAARLVRPGGILVYSTCTFNTTENEAVLEAFCNEHPEFHAEEFSLHGVGDSRDGMIRLWPHLVQGEGHFVAKLRREGDATGDEKGDGIEPPSPRVSSRRADGKKESTAPVVSGIAEAESLLDDLLLRPGESAWPGRWHAQGEIVWIPPAQSPDLDKIRVLRNGLAVAQRKGQGYSPAHALAMAYPPSAFSRSVSLDDEQAARFLRGEALPLPSGAAGWTCVSYKGLSLGWGKQTQGILKNHLPKGLRRNG